MRTIVIELLRFDKDGKTCARCEDTAQAVKGVITKMSALLREVRHRRADRGGM